jgi:hypothetical protein
MHPRAAIRHAVRDLLIAADTLAGERVHPTRVLSIRKKELPLIAVYTSEEQVDAATDRAPRELTRTIDLEIAAWVDPGPGGAKVDDAMDAIAAQIEAAMHADPYLADTASESVLVSTSMGVQGEGDDLLGLVTLSYDVTYLSLAPEPPADGDLDDFRRAGTTTNLGGVVHEDDQAEDLTTVQADPP